VVQFAATVNTGTHVLVEGASGHGNCCFEHSTITEPLNIQLQVEQIREPSSSSYSEPPTRSLRRRVRQAEHRCRGITVEGQPETLAKRFIQVTSLVLVVVRRRLGVDRDRKAPIPLRLRMAMVHIESI
jgi:hypothetical protein